MIPGSLAKPPRRAAQDPPIFDPMGSRQSQAASETTQLRPSSALVIAPPSSRRTQKNTSDPWQRRRSPPSTLRQLCEQSAPQMAHGALPALGPILARSGRLAVASAGCLGNFRTSATTPTSCFLIHRSSMRSRTLLLSATSACRGSPRNVAPAVAADAPQARSEGP